MLPCLSVIPQNYHYYPSNGMSTVSTISNTNFGLHGINNQYQQLMQFTSDNTSVPITVSNNKQLVHQTVSTQSSFLRTMASQVLISQEIFNGSDNQSATQIISTPSNFPNLMASQVLTKQEVVDSNNNDGSNIVNNSGQNDVIINNTTNNVNNNKPVPIKVIGLKPGQNLSMNNIQGLLPRTQGSIYLKTKNGFQLVTIGSELNNVDQNFQPVRIAPKGKLNLNQSPVVSSQTSVASRITASVPSVIVNTTASSTMKTISANSVVSTSPAASTQSNEQKNGLQKLYKFFHYLLFKTTKAITADGKKQLQNLIQSFIDKEIGAEDFSSNLVVILNSESQPGLINFLNLNIQLLRRALYLGELILEGIRAPPVNVFSPLHPMTATNNQIFIKISGARSILLPVNGSQSQKILKSPVTVPATIPSSTVNVSVVNKTMPAASSMVSSTVMVDTTQVKNSRSLLISPKAPIQAVNALDKFKPVFTSVSGKRIIKKSPAVTCLKTYQNLSTVISNINKLSFPKISTTTVPLMSTISNASGISLPIMSYGNVKNLSVSTSSTVQKSLNYEIKIDNLQPVNKKRLTTSALAKDNEREVPLETNVADLTDIMQVGGVDIEKESEIILSSHEKIGVEIRSCEDKLFLISSLLKEKINKILQKHGLEECNEDVLALVSHATEQRLKDLVEKMAVVAEHRVDFNRADPQYEATQDVRAQLRFLEEVDKAQREKREAEERQAILKASKSKSKNDELVKLKEQAKAIQKAEMEERMTRATNLTALQALGPQRKKPRLENNSALTRRFMRPRIKRVCIRDLIFVLQQEKYSCRSQFLYKIYLKSIKK
ncbi:transcription initiation factor TFIID subunit 4-like [Cotesia typhae]|uniref:transcription initiation factor TFIID subunit 4-like n=1 Tax=Cotesia typhae TaxID=2053667 RepID=UPI003D695A0D